jgi:uncharacterized iron-regulated protein
MDPARMPLRIAALLLLLAPMSACTTPPKGADAVMGNHANSGYLPPPVLDISQLLDFDTLAASLHDRRVVYIGETHDRYEHHLTQLELIRRLHEQHPGLTVAMEFFDQPSQPHLDAYIAGEISERELLDRSEYFQRWGYDYRHYQPILHFAREHGLATLALNIPREITRKIAQEGIEALDETERAWLPRVIDRSDEAYQQRLRTVFDIHPDTDRDFDHFVDAQLVWDEAMAQRAADYLHEHPDQRMALLAGSGHLAYRSGIPQRLERELAVTSAVILPDWAHRPAPGLADYVLFPQPKTLAPIGKLGIVLSPPDEATVWVRGFTDDSPAKAAGVVENDHILAIDTHRIETITDLRLAMLNKRAGDQVQLRVTRDGEERVFRVTLY